MAFLKISGHPFPKSDWLFTVSNVVKTVFTAGVNIQKVFDQLGQGGVIVHSPLMMLGQQQFYGLCLLWEADSCRLGRTKI